MTTTKTMIALTKREFLEGKNGYFWTPVILAGVMIALVIFSAAGFGNLGVWDHGDRIDVANISDALSMAQEEAAREGKGHELPAAVTLLYWALSTVTGLALPFVILFSLLSALYEERRDKSILFWKSMPVADWQEVLAKLIMPAFGAPLIFLGVVFAAQFAIALFLSVIVLFQGGPVGELWPLGLMLASWWQGIALGFFKILWMLPIMTWLLFVSAFSNRMPFLFAILPPIVLMAVEAIMFETSSFGEWLGLHLGGWQFDNLVDRDIDINGPRDLLDFITGISIFELMEQTFLDIRFWLGSLVAGGLFFGCVEFRKRAI